MIHMISDTNTYAKEIIQINYLTLIETLMCVCVLDLSVS